MVKRKKNKRRKKIKLSFPSLIFNIIFTVISIGLIYVISTFNIIPTKYYVPILIFLIGSTILIDVILIFRYKKKYMKVIKIIFIVIASILMIGYSVGIYYLNKTMNLFDNIAIIKEDVNYYYIMVLSDSKYEETSDLYKKKMAYYEKTPKEVTDKIKLSLTYNAIKDASKVKDELYNKKVDAILISDIIKNKYEEDDEEFSKKVKILETIEIKKAVKDITKKVSIRNTPFNVLISGIDTYGPIETAARNDVNIVASVNPNTGKILLTSIPRDYYVQLHGTKGYKDKLTHASYYGNNMVIQTIEDILDIDINYYVKVNFSTVLKLIDEIGGVDVYSDQYLPFCKIRKGMNHLNGECALQFARERHSYEGGDRHRGMNQQAIITAVFKKLTSGFTLVTQYTDILSSLDGKFATSIPMDQITDFLKHKLIDLPNFTMESIQVDGTGLMAKTYSYPGQDLWVMVPDQDTVKKAHDKIMEVTKDD